MSVQLLTCSDHGLNCFIVNPFSLSPSMHREARPTPEAPPAPARYPSPDRHHPEYLGRSTP